MHSNSIFSIIQINIFISNGFSVDVYLKFECGKNARPFGVHEAVNVTVYQTVYDLLKFSDALCFIGSSNFLCYTPKLVAKILKFNTNF